MVFDSETGAAVSLRVAIIGCGPAGARRAQTLRALGIGELTVVDSVARRARALARSVDANLGESAAAAAANSDAVLVCTSLPTRATVALMALREGAHVFVESPVSEALPSIGPLLDVVKRKRRVLMAASWARFHPALERIRILLEARTVGRLQVASFWIGGPAPAEPADLRDPGRRSAPPPASGVDPTPWLDALRWLFGNPHEVAALSANGSASGAGSEAVAAIFRLERGGIVQLCVDGCHGAADSMRLEVVGSDGSITWTARDGRIAVNRLGGRERRDEQIPVDDHDMASAELRHFLACVLTGRAPVLDGPEARAIVGLVLASRRALRTRRSIAVGDYLRGGRRSAAAPVLRLVHAG